MHALLYRDNAMLTDMSPKDLQQMVDWLYDATSGMDLKINVSRINVVVFDNVMECLADLGKTKETSKTVEGGNRPFIGKILESRGGGKCEKEIWNNSALITLDLSCVEELLWLAFKSLLITLLEKKVLSRSLAVLVSELTSFKGLDNWRSLRE